MFQSDEFFRLDQKLREAGKVGQSLRLSLLRHFGKLIRDLTCNLDTDVLVARTGLSRPECGICTESNSGRGETPVQVLGTIALSEYGDEVTLHAVRMEALRIFEARSLSAKP